MATGIHKYFDSVPFFWREVSAINSLVHISFSNFICLESSLRHRSRIHVYSSPFDLADLENLVCFFYRKRIEVSVFVYFFPGGRGGIIFDRNCQIFIFYHCPIQITLLMSADGIMLAKNRSSNCGVFVQPIWPALYLILVDTNVMRMPVGEFLTDLSHISLFVFFSVWIPFYSFPVITTSWCEANWAQKGPGLRKHEIGYHHRVNWMGLLRNSFQLNCHRFDDGFPMLGSSIHGPSNRSVHKHVQSVSIFVSRWILCRAFSNALMSLNGLTQLSRTVPGWF